MERRNTQYGFTSEPATTLLAPCHLSAANVTIRLKRPTPRTKGASNPRGWPKPTTSRYMRSCNPSCVEPPDVTNRCGGLLPHHFTLTRFEALNPLGAAPKRAVCFCYASQALTDLFQLGRTALCVARTFLCRHGLLLVGLSALGVGSMAAATRHPPDAV